MLKNKTLLYISSSISPTIPVNDHLSCLTSGRVPKKDVITSELGTCILKLSFTLRTPELVGLAHRFCASFCLYSSKFREKNQIIINSMKHGMCNIHISDYFFKYFV